MKTYDDDMKLKDALQLFFSKYHFADGGYHLKWFKIKIGPLFIPLPNIKARVAVAKIHDIHHVLTEYEANLKGEAEIAGWEIASSCGKYLVAWFFNLGAFFYGMFFFPSALLKAFMLGSKAHTNFYLTRFDYDTLLNKTLGEIRQSVENGKQENNSFREYLYFILYCLFTLVLVILFVYLLFKGAEFIYRAI